jgi:hypothetical protein
MPRSRPPLPPLSPDDRVALARLQQLPRAIKQLIMGALTLAEDEGDDVACWWLDHLRAIIATKRSGRDRFPRVH